MNVGLHYRSSLKKIPFLSNILKIKYNFKKFSKMEKLVKVTIAFTLKTIIVLIITFPQIFKCSTKEN